MEAWMQKAIDREVEAHGEVRPPWEVHPEIPAGSIGWRMGYGESFMMVWWQWWEDSSLAEAERIAYLRRHPPPARWLDWAGFQVWGDEIGSDEVGVLRLESHGIGRHADWLAACASEVSDDEDPQSG